MKETPRWVAVHEAGHVTASFALQRELGRPWSMVERVFIRSMEEAAVPYVDDRGRANDCIGMVEGPSRYNPLGIFVPDMAFNGPEEERKKALDAMRVNMEADVIGLLAGPLAEVKCRRQAQWMACLVSDDFEQAKRKAADFCRDPSEIGPLVDGLWKQSAKLVRDPANWKAINVLADALMERRSLSGDEAFAIVSRTWVT